jgi:hypothetical protein
MERRAYAVDAANVPGKATGRIRRLEEERIRRR